MTAKSEIEDRIQGLDLGADDYLPKPFAMGELLARIRAMLRRREEFTPDILTCGNLSLNQQSYELSCNNKSVVLPKLEYQLMEVLMLNQGIYLSSEKLLTKVWGYDTDAELGIVWVYISYLRKRLSLLHANAAITQKEIQQTLDSLLAFNRDAGGSAAPLQPESLLRQPGNPGNAQENALSSTFFVVRFGGDGTVLFTDVSHISFITEEQAVVMAQEVLNTGTSSGSKNPFCYRIDAPKDNAAQTIVFLDTSRESASELRVLLLSIALGILCWLFMLLLVTLLSRKAINPIAQNIDRQKKFITNAGHELKTPLATILANTEALELHNGESKWSRNIRSEIGRLSSLVNQLLLLARMDEGAAQSVAADFSLSSLTQDILQPFLSSMELKQITLTTDIHPDIVLHADREQIAQLLSILLDNAVKYVNPQGEIVVRLTSGSRDRKVTLLIQNTCRQLPDAPPDKLFDRFYRADRARTREDTHSGFGIGLSVADAIVKANNGSIHAAYPAPDTISFTVSF